MKKNTDYIPDVINNLEKISRSLNQYSKAADKLNTLTGPQRLALRTLANSIPIRVSDLARIMRLHPSTIVGVLDRLERKSLITRTRSSKDRRNVYVEITSQGVNVIADSPETAQTILAKDLETLTEEQFACVVKGVELLADLFMGGNYSTQQLSD